MTLLISGRWILLFYSREMESKIELSEKKLQLTIARMFVFLIK